jgi:hypothetical protein
MDTKINTQLLGMKRHLLVNCLLLVLIANSCKNSKSLVKSGSSFSTEKDSLISKQRALLKKYALCKCLMQDFPKDSTLINDGSLMAYIELGSYSNKAYDTVDVFVSKGFIGKYVSKQNSKLYLMKCIDMYNSAELNELVRNLDVYLSIDTDSLSK